jgi:hypothetical protein
MPNEDLETHFITKSVGFANGAVYIVRRVMGLLGKIYLICLNIYILIRIYILKTNVGVYKSSYIAARFILSILVNIYYSALLPTLVYAAQLSGCASLRVKRTLNINVL